MPRPKQHRSGWSPSFESVQGARDKSHLQYQGRQQLEEAGMAEQISSVSMCAVSYAGLIS
jgi:hypothetical protein